MDEMIAKVLLQSFLERLDADASTDKPQFTGIMSSRERQALRLLLGGMPQNEPAPAVLPVEPPSAEQVESGIANTPLVAPAAVPEEVPDRIQPGPRNTEMHLDEGALSGQQSQDLRHVLALDFGTAKSKAFAASIEEENDDPELIELGLGRRDRDIDGGAYTVSSSIWISNEGLMYVGAEALRLSMNSHAGVGHRERLDSIKKIFTLAGGERNLGVRRLEPKVNPTKVDLTYEDAMCFFLGYLTDLAVTELQEKGHSRYIKRRFTVPAWPSAQRDWAASALSRYLLRAQLLADTFKARWKDGVPVEEVKAAVSAAAVHEKQLGYLLDETGAPGVRKGLLEPLAAGSGRIWADNAAKNLVVIVDVGAGTTDFSAFWVVQNIGKPGRRAYAIPPCSGALPMAGDMLDDILVLELISRSMGGLTGSMRSEIELDLRLRGARQLKEQLFRLKKLEVSLITKETISIELGEFLENPRVKQFGDEVASAINSFLDNVDSSWSKVPGRPLLILAGGGANLPMIQDLGNKVWHMGTGKVVFDRTPELPVSIASRFDTDFQREYPQLAVAIGGALPVLDEKTTMPQWLGATTSPGPLERVQLTGI
jgi:molecular chaperone HscA